MKLRKGSNQTQYDESMEKSYTKYEKARIVGARALELAYGAPPLIKVPEGVVDPVKLAVLEFDKGVIPITVIRPGSGDQ